MDREIFWDRQVGGNADVARVLHPHVPVSHIKRWRAASRTTRKRPTAGPNSQFRASEVAQLLFESGAIAAGVPLRVASDVWTTAGLEVVARRNRYGSDTELLPTSLIIFRQADGAWATALADDTVAADPAALAGARVFTTVRVDALLDTVAAAIRQHCPACPAVTGGEALKRRSIAAREIA